MNFKPYPVQGLNSLELTDFIQCSMVQSQPWNWQYLKHCICFVFKSSKFSPLKGSTGIEHAATPFGVGRRV